MGGPTTTRKYGCVSRIYKNSNNKVLAIVCIDILVDTLKISPTKFHNSAYKITDTTKYHLELGNRTVAIIQMCGNYSSLSEDSGNYLTATWQGKENINDFTISFEDLPQLGDVI
jgi:hypothetical protein